MNPCPKCREPIPAANINIAEGVGLCPACGRLSNVSSIADLQEDLEYEENLLSGAPPPGCSMLVIDGETRIKASLRSLIAGLWLLAGATLVTGIISCLAFNVFFSSDRHWEFGATVFACLFMIPFLSFGVFLAVNGLLCIAGEIDVRLMGPFGSVRTGIGPAGWTQRFGTSDVKSVKFSQTSYEENGRHLSLIEIVTDRKVRFGSRLTNERREWLQTVLKYLLVQKKNCIATKPR